MPRGLGFRFAAEAAFLVAVAVVAVVADFRWQAILVSMALAWLLVSAVEWFVSRPSRPRERAQEPAPRREPAPAPRSDEVERPQHVRVLAQEPDVAPKPEPEPEPEPAPEPERPPLASVPPPPEPQPEPEPEPAPEPQQPTAPVVSFAARDTRPREWNLWELERLARENAADDPARGEERNFLLMYLREFANPDGALPLDFDALVRDAFGDVLAAATAR